MEADSANQEKPVYKKIVEYKKKISLVEGKRRAMFNKFEHEKHLNKEKENELDIELKVKSLFQALLKDFVHDAFRNQSIA